MNDDGQDLPLSFRNGDYSVADAPTASRGPEFIEAAYSEIPQRQLHDYLRVFSRHRWTAAACFFGVVLLTAVATWLTPRAYSSSVRVQVARNSPIQLQLKENVLNLD